MDKYKFGCTGKIPFISKAEAIAYNRGSHGKKLLIYPCLYRTDGKTHYHFTSMPRAEFKRRFKKIIKNI